MKTLIKGLKYGLGAMAAYLLMSILLLGALFLGFLALGYFAK